jgi:hypothetical protein
MQALSDGRGVATIGVALVAAVGSGCVSRRLPSTLPVDASDIGPANVDDAAARRLCELTAVTDIVPATSEIEPYAGLTPDAWWLFVIRPAIGGYCACR